MLGKLVIENLKHRPARTILGILAIGVAVTMILTLVGLSRGMIEDSVRRARGVGADILVRPPGTSAISLSTAPIPEKMVEFLAKQPHVTAVSGTMVQPLSGISSITGIDLKSFEALSGGFEFIAGGPFSGKGGEVLVDEYYARQNNLKVGQEIELVNHKWKVAGIYVPGKLARIVVPLKELQELTGNEGRLSQIFLKVDDKEKIPEVIHNLREKLEGYPVYSMEEFTSLIRVDNIPGLRAFIGVIIGVAVTIGFLVVFLSTYTTVLERTREIGVLKSLGATPGFVLRLILSETVIQALLGSVAGVILTFITRWVIMTLAPSTLAQVLVPDWWPIAAGIALAAGMLGAVYPGLRAARQDPIEALSYD